MSSDTTATTHSCHILGGMHNDPPTKCWLELLRYGVVFRIEALADDPQDTPLHRQWQTLLKDLYAPGMTIQDRIDRWEQLCNVLIETSLPVLQDLAPEVPRDRSLWACFHTPTYHLQLIRDSLLGAVFASVTSGPVDGSPSGCQVAKVGGLDAFAPGLTQYPLRDFEIVETDGGSSFPPGKVRTPDGVLHGFKACVQDSKRPITNHVSNHHRDAIHAYLRLHKDPLDDASGIPSVSGIVVEEEGELAGVLLQDIQATGNLASRLHSITSISGLEKVRQLAPGWQARISSIVAALHGRGYCLNEVISQSGLDESELVVDKDDRIWLPLSHIFLLDNKERDEFRERASEDDEAVRRVFEEFVPEELKKREAELESR